MDRFIPTRSAIDLDLANLHLTKENGSSGGSTEAGGPSGSPSKDEYQKMLADSLGVDSSGRILAFKQKVRLSQSRNTGIRVGGWMSTKRCWPTR
jgi:cell division cycle protein 20 (cofactor of APC complex)